MNILCVVLLWASAQPAELAGHLDQDFRDKQFDDKLFRLVGSEPEQYVLAEPEGLRITLPSDTKKLEPTGIAARAPIRGDFEITLCYEILQAEPPTAGYGVGLTVYLVLDSPSRDSLTFGRLLRTKEGDVYTVSRASTNPDGKRQIGKPTTSPAVAKAGKLRLSRVGAAVTLAVAEGAAEQFRPLQEVELGKSEVRTLRVAADNGGSTSPVAVRLQDIRIRSAASPQQDAAEARPRPRVLWAAFAALAVGVLACAGWLWYRVRARAGAADSPPARRAASQAAAARLSPER